ncbi:MAG: flagellar hook-length control protein FliK [Planctomycetales bacterium]|nr:flagellar hook-length control protein FliK [Planctomycetales bacterium]
MSPPVDNIGLLLNELPPPSAAPSRAARSNDASFQDHLARAGGTPEGRERSDRSEESRRAEADIKSSSAKTRRDEDRADAAAEKSQEKSVAAEGAVVKEKPATGDATSETAEDTAATNSSEVGDNAQGENSEDGEERNSEDAVAAALAALVQVAPKPDVDEVTISDEAVAEEKPAVDAVAPAKGEKPRPEKSKLTEQFAAAGTTQAGDPAVEQPTIVQADALAEAVPPAEAPPVKTEVQAAADELTTVVQERSPVEKTAARMEQGEKHLEAEVTAAGEVAKPAGATVEAVAAGGEQAGDSDRRERRESSDGRSTSDGKSETAAQAVASQNTAGPTPENIIAAAQSAVSNTATEATAKDNGTSTATGSVEGAPDAKGRATQPVIDAQRAAGGGAAAGRVRSAAETTGHGDLSQADRVRLVQRVAKAVQSAVERGGDLQIRLSPPELGSLRLQVKLADGVLSAKLEAETPQAKQILTDNLPQLRERLAQQDIRIEKFDVDLFSSGGGGGPSYLPDRRQDAPQDSSPQGPRGGGGVRRVSGSEAASSSTPTVRISGGNGRLDIVV